MSIRSPADCVWPVVQGRVPLQWPVAVADVRQAAAAESMQGVQNEIRNRIRHLQLGAAPHQRRMEYVRNDYNITLAKEALQDWIDTVPELQNAPADIPPDIQQNLLTRLLQHFNRIQHTTSGYNSFGHFTPICFVLL